MWIKVANTNEIPSGGWKTVPIENSVVVIVNLEGDFFAFIDSCTHDGSPLAGEPLEGDTIVCPRHGARFCVKTGRVLEGPAYEDLLIFPVKIEDGLIWIQYS